MKEIRDALRILKENNQLVTDPIIDQVDESVNAPSDAATLREITARVGRVLAAVHEDDTSTLDNVLRKAGYDEEHTLEILRDQVTVSYNGAVAVVKFDAVFETETGSVLRGCAVTVDGGAAKLSLGNAFYHDDSAKGDW